MTWRTYFTLLIYSMFECKLCGYSTNRSTDMERHNKTKRHINKVSEQPNETFNCAYCDKSFTAKTNMYRHQKYNCTLAPNYVPINIKHNEPEQIKKIPNICADIDLYKIIEKLQEEKKMLENENGNLKGQNDKLINLATHSSKTAEKSVRGITYAMKHLKNAQQLKLLKGNEAMKLLTYDNKKSGNATVEIIIIKHRNKLLEQYLGDILVNAYKTDDPEIQSLWNVDTTRLHFILKEKEWTSDNCGVKITKFVIDPFLKSVQTMINEYCDFQNKPGDDENSEGGDNSNFEIFTRKWESCQEILMDISKKKLHKQILKYISSRLKLSASVQNKSKKWDIASFSSDMSVSDEKPKKSTKNIVDTKKKRIIVDSDSD